jgi:hypothetical protein
VVQRLLQEGFYPIVWCRYVATAEYVGQELTRALPQSVQVTIITGRLGDEERRVKIDEIDPDLPHVLVATDCLSEGINLQEKFTAALHYDLPWNPNRLEQREGRVDRLGQTAAKVKAIRFYGRDNPVDGAVIEVLLDKAREIHRTLGTYVPVPEASETVMEAVFNSLFRRRQPASQQLCLFDDLEELSALHRRWDENAQRERHNRNRFAQRALKPEQVRRELEAVDAVLGDPQAVRQFVLEAAQRLGLSIGPQRAAPEVFVVDVSPAGRAGVPEAVRFELPQTPGGRWRISFVSPTPKGAEYVGRNHRLVATLARYLLEEALQRGGEAAAARCGVFRTRDVSVLTTLMLLRVRYLVEIPQQPPLLSEEALLLGRRASSHPKNAWLEPDEALKLLATARPTANMLRGEKEELLAMALGELGRWAAEDGHGAAQANPPPASPDPYQAIAARIAHRAKDLEQAHKRLRQAVRLRVRELKVTPQLPPDLLGLLVLQPEVQR